MDLKIDYISYAASFMHSHLVTSSDSSSSPNLNVWLRYLRPQASIVIFRVNGAIHTLLFGSENVRRPDSFRTCNPGHPFACLHPRMCCYRVTMSQHPPLCTSIS